MTFLPAFCVCVEAVTFGVMCSYKEMNGVPSCANPFLLTRVLREELGFQVCTFISLAIVCFLHKEMLCEEMVKFLEPHRTRK